MTLALDRVAWKVISIAGRSIALGLILCIVVLACAFYFVYHLLHFQRDLGTFGRMATFGLLLVLSCVTAFAGTESPSLPQLYQRVNDAVVVVRTSEHVVATRQSNVSAVSIAGLGSGVLVEGGRVVTAAHVVQSADAVTVEFADGALVNASIIASDPAADVALLRLERVPEGISPVRMGDSDQTDVGEQIFIVGAPFGITHTLTVGHVSARRLPKATFGGMISAELFQTDASINQGNSGGPMFNMRGEVIGIVSHIVSRTGGSDGLGFVVTSKVASQLLFQEPTVWSGLDGFLLTGDLARAFNLPGGRAGLLVQRVADRSPAATLGLRGGRVNVLLDEEELIVGGDVILAVGGITLDSLDSQQAIRHRLATARASRERVHVTVLRAGEIVDLSGDTALLPAAGNAP